MRKPRLITACVANTYAAEGERIAEFSFPEAASDSGDLPGGLMSLRWNGQSPPVLEVYNVKGVRVLSPDFSALEPAARAAFNLLTVGVAAQGLKVNPYSLAAVRDLGAALGITPWADKPPEPRGEHPTNTRAMWRAAVLGGETRGYWDWANAYASECAKLAGYDVEPDGFGGGYIARDPDGVEIEQKATERSWPTECAAWEACDRHRMLGSAEQ